MAANGNLIHLIAIHATAETSLPTLASVGSNISQANWSSAGFDTIGNVDLSSNDHNLEEDSVDVSILREFIGVEPARSLGLDDEVVKRLRPEAWTFRADGIQEALMAFDSNFSQASNKTTLTGTTTLRTVAIEVRKKGVIYFPSCRVSVSTISLGYGDDGRATCEITVMPLATSTIPGAIRLEHYV